MCCVQVLLTTYLEMVRVIVDVTGPGALVATLQPPNTRFRTVFGSPTKALHFHLVSTFVKIQSNQYLTLQFPKNPALVTNWVAQQSEIHSSGNC